MTPPSVVAAIGSDPGAIAAVVLIVGALMVVDLFAFARGREPGFRESLWWSLGWLVLGVAAAIPIALLYGTGDGVSYTTVYVIERTLSLDNLVVFLLIFGYFAVPQALRGRLLFWGIILALAMRGVAIVVGIGLLNRFHVVIYILGLLLMFLAWRMWAGSLEHQDPGRNPLVRLVKRFFPVSDYSGGSYFVRISGRLSATPLVLALASVVAADIAFAVDSIPAAFAITDDPLVIWAANGFALLGLRALFVLVEQLTKRFRYLNRTIALVLGVVALKLLLSGVWKAPPALSLAIVIGLFAGGIVASRIAERREAGPAT